MELDHSVVVAFSTQVHNASTTIADTHLGHDVSACGDGLAGSTTQYAARLVGDFMSKLVADHSANVDRMGRSVSTAAQTIVVQDDAVKEDLDSAWAQR